MRGSAPVPITPPPVNFERMPQMDRLQWEDIMRGMHACFSVPPATQSRTSQTGSSQANSSKGGSQKSQQNNSADAFPNADAI